MNGQKSSSRLRLAIEGGEAWARVSWLGALDEEDAPVLTSTDPAVVRFVSELIGLFPVEPDVSVNPS